MTRSERTEKPALGQVNYEAWSAEIGSSALQSWAELGEPVKRAWYAAATTVIGEVWKEDHKDLVAQWEAL